MPVPEPGAFPEVLDRPPGFQKLHDDVSVNLPAQPLARLDDSAATTGRGLDRTARAKATPLAEVLGYALTANSLALCRHRGKRSQEAA